MANPFEMLGQFQQFKEQSEQLLEATDTAWFVRAGAAQVLAWVLTAALDAGPPPGFGAQLGVNDEQGRVIFNRVLRAAILRQKELALHAG